MARQSLPDVPYMATKKFNSSKRFFLIIHFLGRWVSVLNNSRTEALEKAFGDSDKAEVI